MYETFFVCFSFYNLVDSRTCLSLLSLMQFCAAPYCCAKASLLSCPVNMDVFKPSNPVLMCFDLLLS